MRQIQNAYTLGAALLALGLAGCSGRGAKVMPPAAKPATGAPAVSLPPDVAGAALGTAQTSSGFEVTLSSAGPLAKGKDAFEAAVRRGGKPVSDATVTAVFSMPSMKMLGDTVTLKEDEDGRYRGTARLGMEGDWQANVTVEASGKKGTAVYDFRTPSTPRTTTP